MPRNRLLDTGSIRRELARLYYQVLDNEISESKAHRLNNILNVMLKAVGQQWQENRLLLLQEQVDELLDRRN